MAVASMQFIIAGIVWNFEALLIAITTQDVLLFTAMNQVISLAAKQAIARCIAKAAD